jgi:hypothetical protein
MYVLTVSYSSCYLDDMVIQVGLTINSISGAFNFIVTFVVWALGNTDLTVATGDLRLMYNQVVLYNTAAAEVVTAASGT